MSEETWYVRHDNRILGPLALSAIAEGLRSRALTWLDVAVQAGDREWRLLDQIPGLRSQLGLESNNHALQEAWIFLRVPKAKGVQRRWFGPWSREAAQARLKSGELSFDDLAWREGMKNWIRVGNLEEFGAKPAEKVAEPHVLAKELEVPASELWGSIVHAGEFKRLQNTPPPEAAGEDLVGIPEWMKCLTIGILALLIPLLNARASGGGNLEIMPLKLASEQASLVLQTDAAVDQPIQVSIKGRSGEILELPSYRRTLQVKRQAGEVPTLSLAELKLPHGRYQVEAVVGETRVVSSIFLGVDDAAFQAALAQHQKSIAAEQQLEKKTLFYSSRDLAALASRLASNMSKKKSPPEWREFYRKWRGELAHSRVSLDRLVKDVHVSQRAFPEQLDQLKKSADQLRHVATQIDEAISHSREPANVPSAGSQELSPSALATEFRKITRESALLSATRSAAGSENQPNNQAE